MSPAQDALNARARGLATHLLGRDRLAALARIEDLPSLAAELKRAGYGPLPTAGRPGPADLELALARGAAARLAILARWAGRGGGALAVIWEEEDCRSLRALLRGAAGEAPAEARRAGLLPTPSLPAAALAELARQPSPGAVATLLVAWGNPYGPPLAEALRGQAAAARPDLFRLETALGRAWAGRALAAARSGGRELRDYVREGIDLANALSALLLAGGAADVDPAACHLPGGRRLPLPAYLAAAGAADRRAAARRLAAVFAGTAFAAALLNEPRERLDAALLALRLREQAAAARRRPLGPAPLLSYLLRLRAEAADLRRLAWGLALGAPRPLLAAGLVTP